MFAVFRSRLLQLSVLPGLAVMGLVLGPAASAAPAPPPLDTVSVTGSTSDGTFTNINISAQSGTLGQNASGSAFAFIVPAQLEVGGQVLCLSVTGPDRGAGTSTAPTTATFVFNTGVIVGGGGGTVLAKVTVVDNGGNGADQFAAAELEQGPFDCGPLPPPPISSPFVTLAPGRAVVFDAPVPANQTNQSGANLNNANLQGANLAGFNFSGATLESAILAGANLTDANLSRANLTFASLNQANLTGANLNQANLTDTNLSGAVLFNANVNRVTWFNTTCPDGTNSDADGGSCLGHL